MPLAQRSLQIFYELDEKRRIARCLGEIARIAYLNADPMTSARLFSAARALLTSIGAEMVPQTWEGWNPVINHLKAELGSAKYLLAVEQGSALSMQAAVDSALAVTS